MRFPRTRYDEEKRSYEIRWHNPGGLSCTYHANLELVYDQLGRLDVKLDEGGLHCFNPHGRRVAVEVLLDGEAIAPLDVARGWCGELEKVRYQYEGTR